MKHNVLGLVGMVGLLAIGVSEASAQQSTVVQPSPSVTNPAAGPSFPPNPNCTNLSPCVNVIGQITRIEESYWVRDQAGQEVHLRVTPESKLGSLPKVGDTIAAQMTSKGDAQAIQQIGKAPEPQIMPVPQTSHENLRR